MKNFTIVALLLAASTAVNAQNVETIRVKGAKAADFIEKSQYKFPAFTKGKVYLKDGEVATARLNFDYFSNVVKYIDEKGDTVQIANTEDVDYITTPMDTFFVDSKFYEWVATSSKARLAARRVLKLAQKEKVGAYGISSPTQNIVSHGMLLDATNYKLETNDEYVFSRETTYFISGPKGKFVEANKKNISKMFPKKDIEEYVKDNNLNLNKEKDLMDLFVYANTK